MPPKRRTSKGLLDEDPVDLTEDPVEEFEEETIKLKSRKTEISYSAREGDQDKEIFESEEFFSITVIDENKNDEKVNKMRKKNYDIKQFSQLPLAFNPSSDFEKIYKAFVFLKELSFEDLEQKFKNKDQELLRYRKDIESIPEDKVIAGFTVDPGSTSCGVGIGDIGFGHIVDADDRRFRDDKEAGEIGKKSSVKRMHEYFWMFKHPSIVILVEDQIAAVLEHHKNVYSDKFHLDAFAIQYALQGMFHDRVIPISPNSVKLFFNMPKVDAEEVAKMGWKQKRQQYELNKKLAVEYGKKFVLEEVQRKILLHWKTNTHNMYDAALLWYYTIQKFNGTKRHVNKNK